MALVWGIVGAGKIAHDFVCSISAIGQNEHYIRAIASRCSEKADQFAKEHQIDIAYDSYLNLAKDPKIEIAYVAVINPYHYEICKLMLENGKHVLCEKPFCMNLTQTKYLIDFAEKKNLFIMEAISSRFFPAYQYIREQIDSGALGIVREIQIGHGIKGTETDRIIKREFGTGVTVDIGVFPIQFAQYIFQAEPSIISATGRLDDDGIDLFVEVELKYETTRIARMTYSALQTLGNKAIIVGTKSQMMINNYWFPTSIRDTDESIKTWQLPPLQKNLNFKTSCGLLYEAEEVKRCIKEGRLESQLLTHRDMLGIIKVKDEIRRQLNVKYVCDEPKM